jgi:hypothetical protein
MATLAAGAAAGCSDNAPATAKSCTSFCITVAAGNVDENQIEGRLKSECESMGRMGKPQILERSATQVSANCPQ